MNDSFGGGGFNASTVGQSDQPTKEGTLPVVIRQLLLVDDEVQMFGQLYAMISTVALVRSIDYTSTKITYKLEDHTGQIDSHYWLEGDDDTQNPQVTLNGYVRAIGSLRTTGEAKVIIVYHLEEITDPNAVVSHLLEVLYVRYKAEAYQKRGGARSNLAPVFGAAGGTNKAMDTAESDNAGGNMYGLPTKHHAIYNLIKERAGSVGLNRKEIETKFSHMSKPEMDTALEYMVTEGIIYTTVDADHYMSVE